MGLKKISIQELCTGMFISELDISWQKTPFFRHKRLVTEQQDIELLKQAGVEWLVIDISKSKLSRVKSKVKIMADASSIVLEQPEAVLVEIQVETPKVKPKSFAPKVALKQELKAAKQVQNEILEAVKTLQKACERGEVISSEAVNPVVEKTLNSIDNNSQAMMALLHEGRDGSKVTMHSFGVFALVLLLSTHLEYSVEDQQELGLAALIHDAGWTKLPIHLMSKGKHYTPTEKKLVTQHITIVKKMLKDQPEISSRVMSVVEQHHEFLDGSGYPKQLKGDDIDPWSRLLTTCNEYDEMVHGLGEHPGMTPQSALSSLFRLSKKGKLDPLYTTHLISLLGVYPIGSVVQLTNEKIGIVVEVNQVEPLKPKVKIFYERAGKESHLKAVVDLMDIDEKVLRVLDVGGADEELDPKSLLLFSVDMVEYTQSV